MTDHSPPIFTLALFSCANGRKFPGAGCAALAVVDVAGFGAMLRVATSRSGIERRTLARVAADCNWTLVKALQMG